MKPYSTAPKTRRKKGMATIAPSTIAAPESPRHRLGLLSRLSNME
jgi:hypothetical protein